MKVDNLDRIVEEEDCNVEKEEDDIMGQILEIVENDAGIASQDKTKEVESKENEVGVVVQDEVVGKKSKRKNTKNNRKRVNDDSNDELCGSEDVDEDTSLKRTTRLRSRRQK